MRRSQWIDFPDQFPRLLRFGNHLIHNFCHRRLRHRLVRHLIYVWNGKFILTNPIGRSKPPQQIKMQESTQSHRLRLYRLIHSAAEYTFLFVYMSQNLITIGYRIIISFPKTINAGFRICLLIIVFQHILISRSHFRIHLCHHLQKSHRLMSSVHVRTCHYCINTCQCILETSLRFKQHLLFYLRFRIHVQPIITAT